MPGKVLARRDLVERDRNSYRLKPDISELTDAERILAGHSSHHVARTMPHPRRAGRAVRLRAAPSPGSP